MTEFPVSGVETWWWLPSLVAFCVSTLTSTGGLSGAFLMLPFQVSVLGFTGPGVTPTNLLYNVVGIPSGVYRYGREKRMLWPLAWAIVIGTMPGMAIGTVIRVTLLPDPSAFKVFAGLVLAFVGVRLLRDVVRGEGARPSPRGNGAGRFEVSGGRLTKLTVEYDFGRQRYTASTPKILLLSFLVGVAGGAYGIGGGAVIAPFLVSAFGLPVYTVAGAALFGTFVSSAAGVAMFWLIDLSGLTGSTAAQPDWLLGLALGIGGAFGTYTGARLQKRVPARGIKALLTAFLLFVAGRYIVEAF
ncbi:MAG TPA: sulfite exporter TauE/SafE family protein [candidate division Zixibacteria bacterium]|nr:sulfite exporter TauE/SafE family protein [candidate division Zixibacteria bacterium]MDD4918629.1 sulfite exporter TauE/SafE family protein [candidate division Zixibacteria bacterium]MDM7972003.1 sulfite exporter TauE/SafE family protein [candidate division Zixibacteria bacterium]HOD66060.1 sulfite exporter TauE/SafE family protein [candidate division Zixibacteria bacterium]HPC10982.1 sulfite exporter TauE/SafE family protein [candidate division Zixibacteria bacterium]